MSMFTNNNEVEVEVVKIDKPKRRQKRKHKEQSTVSKDDEDAEKKPETADTSEPAETLQRQNTFTKDDEEVAVDKPENVTATPPVLKRQSTFTKDEPEPGGACACRRPWPSRSPNDPQKSQQMYIVFIQNINITFAKRRLNLCNYRAMRISHNCIHLSWGFLVCH